MPELKFHDAADQFPLLSDKRLKELARDIKDRGQREAVRMLDGKILDGRNRYLACLKAGVEPEFEELPENVNPYAYAWSRNGERRDLTKDQRYLIWKSCSKRSGEWDAIHKRVQERANQSRSKLKKIHDRPSTDCGHSSAAPRGRGSTELATASKTNRGAVERMERLQRERPDLAEQLKEGKISSADAMRQITTPHVSRNSGDNEWYTPKEYIERIHKVMGDIDLDPASCKVANQIVRATQFFSLEDDGLSRPWHGRVFMNPPYSQPHIQNFTEKLIDHVAAADVSQAVVLVNNATETKWGQFLLRYASAVCFPAGRVKFWHPDKVSAPLQGQMITYMGTNIDTFTESFNNIGAVCHGRKRI
jgi:ParB family chromosome partitioning protein